MSNEEHTGDLVDVALAGEIELVSDLVVAASAADRHFTPDEVDALLGIQRKASPAGGDQAPEDDGETTARGTDRTD